QKIANYNIYLSGESSRDDFYFPALFCDFIKYDKMAEYEITEDSIKRAIFFSIKEEDILKYLKKYHLKPASHVLTTIHQWYDKNGSFYYLAGTVFFSNSPEKGKIISKLIHNKLIKAFEIEENRVFLIPEEEKAQFFQFLDNSHINYYQKEISQSSSIEQQASIVDLHFLLDQ
ncbi:MAG: hypothetical protein MJB14_22100, partial [Spirochaetes bacterium]|nr:hypothetical protein [Spirochaetota bacterium]